MSRVHLMDLVRRADASDADWAYVEDADHVTRGVMCWRVTLFHALIPTDGGYGQYRVAAHTFNLANGAELVTDEYIAHQVLQRLEQADETQTHRHT
jgi:hypothetical protein